MKARVGDVDLFFDVEGPKLVADGAALRERPTLLLLHGGPGADHSWFKPIFSCMTDLAQVVYLDQRGNGRSDRSAPDRWNLETWADDVRAFCETLGIERPVVLGTSFGSVVALTYAIRHPDHPGGLVLDGASARMDLGAVLAVFERLGGVESRTAAERFWTAPSDEAGADYTRVCLPLYSRRADRGGLDEVEARTIWNPELTMHYLRHVDPAFDVRADLHRVACRTLVLAGEDDPVMPAASAREVTAGIDPAVVRLEVVPGSGHGTFRERPDLAFAALRGFLADTGSVDERLGERTN